MKSKTRWLFNVFAVVLCVCAMAIGVYAAKQASLTANGQIGFKAHNCEVILNGTIDAYQSGGDTVLDKTVDIGTNTTTGGKITNVKIGGTGGVSTLTLPAMYFSDTGTNGNTIKLNLTTANQSAFDVKANVSVTGTMPTGVTCAISEDNYIMGALNSTTDEKSFTITFTLSDPTTSADFGDTAFKIIMEFEKYVEPDINDLLKIATGPSSSASALKAGNLYVEMGEYNGTPLKWYAFGFSSSGSETISAGNMQPITSTYTDLSQVKKGTYYFISEFAFYNTPYLNEMADTKEGNEYQNSLFKSELDKIQISDIYKINKSPVYSLISKRTLPSESIGNFKQTDGTSVSGVTTSEVPNQTLWVLSMGENASLLRYNGSSSSSHSNARTALLASQTTNCSYWTRYIGYMALSEFVSLFFCYPSGDIDTPIEHTADYALRPAFKLVIA